MTQGQTFTTSSTFSSQVLFIEFLVSLGSAVLAIVAMPFLDIVTNVMLLNGIAVFSTIFQIAAQCLAGNATQRTRFLIPSIFAFILIVTGHVLFYLLYLGDGERTSEMALWTGLAVAGTILVSLTWWENYTGLISKNSKYKFLKELSADMRRSQTVVNIMCSLLRIAVTAIVLGAYVHLSGRDWTTVRSVPPGVRRVVTILIGVQLVSSALCHWFAVVACKMHALRRSFMLPLYLASLGVLLLFLTPVFVYFRDNRVNLGAGDGYTFSEYCSQAVYGRNHSLGSGVFQELVLDVTHNLCNLDLDQTAQIGLLTGTILKVVIG